MIISTWDIQRWKTTADKVIAEVTKMKSLITVLTETKKKGQGSESGKGKGMERAQAGVSILIKKILKNNLKSWEQINDRIIKHL